MNAMYATIQALLADSTITDVVGNRIHPVVGPQGGYLPDIVVHQISNMDEIALSGACRYPDARVRIECRARKITPAIDLGDLVTDALLDLSGTFASMDVTSFLPEGTDETDSAEDWSTYRRMIDYRVRYREGA